MKHFFIILLITIICVRSDGQVPATDSLLQLLAKVPEDTNRVNLMLQVANKLYFYQPDVSLQYSTEALKLSRQLKYTKGIAGSLSLAGEAMRITGNYPGALKMQFEALELSQKMKDVEAEANCLGFIGASFINLQEYRQALQYLLQAVEILQTLPDDHPGIFTLTNTGRAYDYLQMPDSALYYLRLANEKNKEVRHTQLESFIPKCIGTVYAGIGKTDSALQYFHQALLNSRVSNESINMGRIQQEIAKVYESLERYDSSIYYSRLAFTDAHRTSQKLLILESGDLLTRLYRVMSNPDSAFYFADISAAMKDSLYGMDKFKQLQLLMLEEQQREQQTAKAQEQYRNNVKYTLLLSATGVLLLFSFILLRNNRQKQKAKAKIENAYNGLKAAQAQLIQSEKMASLGELTAGIAHEIQNPLNFVNNFSEVSRELIEEMKEEFKKGDTQEGFAIADDLKHNLEKITDHGQRASSIVKGMLEHSRSNSGQKELTDINELCDEYLKLAYHGLRAKDKAFNTTIETHFDPTLPQVSVIPQDLGRVILNLINNAIYAVNERSKDIERAVSPSGVGGKGGQGQQPIYEPTVSLSTLLTSNTQHANSPTSQQANIQITIKDNGSGIPVNIKEKIFQPFFTTKPTGQGTGLGLSLAYDIVKAHGGELTLESNERVGTEFMIKIPIA